MSLPALEAAFAQYREAFDGYVKQRPRRVALADRAIAASIERELLPELTGLDGWLRVQGVKLPGPPQRACSPISGSWLPAMVASTVYVADAPGSDPWSGLAAVSAPVRPDGLTGLVDDQEAAHWLAYRHHVATISRSWFTPTGAPLIVASPHLDPERSRDLRFIPIGGPSPWLRRFNGYRIAEVAIEQAMLASAAD